MKMLHLKNGKIIPNDNRRYSSTTISVQNMNGAIGMFILKIKRNENTVAVPMVAAGDFSIALRARRYCMVMGWTRVSLVWAAV